MLFGFEDSIGRASTVQLQVLRDRTIQGFQLQLERFHIERLRNRRMLPGYNRHFVTKHLYSDQMNEYAVCWKVHFLLEELQAFVQIRCPAEGLNSSKVVGVANECLAT
jgi:hypothetical protein